MDRHTGKQLLTATARVLNDEHDLAGLERLLPIPGSLHPAITLGGEPAISIAAHHDRPSPAPNRHAQELTPHSSPDLPTASADRSDWVTT
jgi:hypothetical protein